MKKTLIKSFSWAFSYALLLAGICLITYLTDDFNLSVVLFIIADLAAVFGYFIMRREGDAFGLQFAVCSLLSAAASYGGYVLLATIRFHESATRFFAGLGYLFVQQFFWFGLFAADLVFLLVKAGSTARGKRQDRHLKQYEEEVQKERTERQVQ